ncbi:hypothetical protein WOLCODRAFT_20205 [Wolfiporia cocos MD-104 SS10]|uniref:Uncharacterized protein n=1 Tax=Wolfiporia cocos (strain MD-104) TaxID=742152 RepID=A0A2H3J0S8_WOLCO|nr:hypothetical protein WOLCODRAFT_20205 [Wolfiporia cocos MD-104 SS10]
MWEGETGGWLLPTSTDHGGEVVEHDGEVFTEYISFVHFRVKLLEVHVNEVEDGVIIVIGEVAIRVSVDIAKGSGFGTYGEKVHRRRFRWGCGGGGRYGWGDSDGGAEFLDVLLPNIHAKIIQQEAAKRAQWARAEQATQQGGPVEIDPATFIASLDPQLHQLVLMDSNDVFIQSLLSHMIVEADIHCPITFLLMELNPKLHSLPRLSTSRCHEGSFIMHQAFNWTRGKVSGRESELLGGDEQPLKPEPVGTAVVACITVQNIGRDEHESFRREISAWETTI